MEDEQSKQLIPDLPALDLLDLLPFPLAGKPAEGNLRLDCVGELGRQRVLRDPLRIDADVALPLPEAVDQLVERPSLGAGRETVISHRGTSGHPLELIRHYQGEGFGVKALIPGGLGLEVMIAGASAHAIIR